MSTQPAEAKQLLAAAPEDFVAERKRLVAQLRSAGRDDDARALADLRKPSAVVLAVNRAARDRSQAAKDAATAAEIVARAQLSGDADKYRDSLKSLEAALALLTEVAVAHLSRAKPATEPMRRRVADLLRSASADVEARKALQQGMLQEEGGAAGFSAFAGMAAPARSQEASSARTKEAERKEQARGDREQRLEAELAQAEKALGAAEKAFAAAERERDKAARAVASASQRLERFKKP